MLSPVNLFFLVTHWPWCSVDAQLSGYAPRWIFRSLMLKTKAAMGSTFGSVEELQACESHQWYMNDIRPFTFSSVFNNRSLYMIWLTYIPHIDEKSKNCNYNKVHQREHINWPMFIFTGVRLGMSPVDVGVCEEASLLVLSLCNMKSSMVFLPGRNRFEKLYAH